MKKSLSILATTTASTLLITLATGCGNEDDNQNKSNQASPSATSSDQKLENDKLNLSIKDIRGSKNTERCYEKCKIQDL